MALLWLTEGTPLSELSTISVYRGILPRNGTSYFLAASSPPPFLKIFTVSPQCGQTKPLMFSTSPRTFSFICEAKLMAFFASSRATSCGVTTTTTPSTSGTIWATLSASSPVPGGISIMTKSLSPQATSSRNCCSALCLSAPLHMTAVSSVGRRNPMDMTSTLYLVFTGRILPSSLTSTFSSETPSIFGSSGPFISASMSPTL